eukprot:SAG31_NODE_16574_length_703_cov_1.448675_1_plen_72_part_10
MIQAALIITLLLGVWPTQCHRGCRAEGDSAPLLAPLPPPAPPPSPLPETDWLSAAGHGVFTHFLNGLQNENG